MASANLLVEFPSASALVAAVAHLSASGYRRIETYSPFPIEELEHALKRPHSRLPLAIFFGGVGAAGAAYLLQWYLVAYLYPLDVGGRPPHFPLAFVPITFEMGILVAAFVAVFGVIWLGRLLTLWEPVFEVDAFRSASADRFWLEISAQDPLFDLRRTREELAALGALQIMEVRS
jgi:hypothetical protein